MTNKEAINFLQSKIDLIDKYYPDVKDYREALVIAIEALEQKPCEDCISRQAVLDCFKKWQPYMATRLLDFEKELSELPPVTPRPRAGHWIVDVDRWGDIVTTVNGYRSVTTLIQTEIIIARIAVQRWRWNTNGDR